MIRNNNLKPIVLILGMMLIAANLRAPIVVVGPVTPDIIASLHLSLFSIGMITTIPLLCFAFGSALMPKLATKTGLELALVISVVVSGIGIFIRSSGSPFLLFTGSIIIGIGITIANVLIPPFIKKYFPDRIGLLTAFYLAFINISSALAVGFSTQLGMIGNMGWRSSLGIWVVLSIITVPVWIFIHLRRSTSADTNNTIKSNGSIWKSGLAWQISIFMGMQSVLYYVFAAWLPTILQDWGMEASKSGWILFYVQMSQVPALFVGSLLATKPAFQNRIVIVGSIMMLIGILLILFWKTTFIVLAGVLSGVSVGLIFSLVTVFFGIRTSTVEASVKLSGMAQAIGYFIAGCFPPLFGFVYESFGSWETSLSMLILIPIIMFFVGRAAAKDRMIEY